MSKNRDGHLNWLAMGKLSKLIMERYIYRDSF